MSGLAGARRVPASILLLTILLFGVAGWCVVSRALSPSDGSTVSVGDSAVSMRAASGGTVRLVEREPAGPLRLGDEVVAIDGVPLAERAGRLLGGPAAEVGDTLRYEVLRDGRHIELDVRLMPYPVFTALLRGWPTLLVVGLLLLTSAAIFGARPKDPATHAALLASSIALVTTSGSTFFPLEAVDLVAGDQFWRWYVGEFGFTVLWAAMLHLALAFPAVTDQGRFRNRVVLGYLGGPTLYAAACGIAVLVLDGPLQRLAIVGSPVLPALFSYPLVILWVLIHKYVTSYEPMDRRRLRWLASSLGGGAAIYFAVWAVPFTVSGTPLLPAEFQTLAFLPVPIAMAVAVLRHNALNLEVVISRSLVYVTLSAGVVGLYVALVSTLSLIFPPIDKIWQQAAAAATVAVLMQPLRNRLQSWVNSRLYGDRDDPYRVVSTLASRLENTHTPGSMLPAIVETVSAALRLPYVAIEIQARGRTETAASVGTAPAEPHRMPLTFHGERVGYLVVARRSAREALSRRDRVALAEVARHAGAAVYTARLTRDLRRSRDRLVRARENERRRILHELHDGVGPTLAAVALGLDASQRSVGKDTATGVLLARLRDELQAAIVEIRRLAHGLRPPVLDRMGLIPALREYAGALASRTARTDDAPDGVTIVLEVPSIMPRLPASVDVAAYRIICEALTNVTRHASARSCAVRLWVDDDLHIEVVDDGIGLPELTNGDGVGLSSMRERASELGGECLIQNETSGGTRVFATLPLPKEVV